MALPENFTAGGGDGTDPKRCEAPPSLRLSQILYYSYRQLVVSR